MSTMNMKKAALTISITLLILTVFQLALVAGAPWGKAAWGGQNEVLPTSYRIASVVSIIIYGLIVWVTRRRVSKPGRRGFRIGTWIFFAYFCFGVLFNAISTSPIERIWVPVNLLLAWSLYVVAKGRNSSIS